MALYRRGKIWWYVFEFGGRKIQESSGFQNKTAAEGVNGSPTNVAGPDNPEDLYK